MKVKVTVNALEGDDNKRNKTEEKKGKERVRNREKECQTRRMNRRIAASMLAV